MSSAVSVLIPAYNSGSFLAETIDSIRAQTYPPAEIIVVDDGSTDGTRETALSMGDTIRYHSTANGGICRARNTAASLATSPYLAFCDHDDLWRPDKLAQQMALHDANPTLEYSFTNFAFVIDGVWTANSKLDDAPSDFFATPPPADGVAYEHAAPLYESLLRFQPIWPSTIVVARALFERIGGFREEFGKNPSEDLEFTLRCVQQGPLGVVSQPVVGVRRHPGNYSGENYRNTRGQIEILEYVLRHHAIPESTRSLVRDQIERRRVEASYDAFLKGEFDQVTALLADVPNACLNKKTRLKKLISQLPTPLAKTAHHLLTRQ